MTVLAERDLQMTLPVKAKGRKFDDKTMHGLSHCMKAVDFIVELEDQLLFIEFKDPENPDASLERSAEFIKKFRAGQLDSDLKTKYRDSWLYEWAKGQITKPVFYLVLIGASALSAAELVTRTDALKRQLPVADANGQPWKKPFVAGCAVMNMAAWNKALPQFPVSRVGV
jgi:hypothetical protein